MLDIDIEEHVLQIGPRFAVSFHRTLRIPDDGRIYPLPPGLGAFPIFKVEDYLDRVPALWAEQKGAFIPMYQREALWLGFNAAPWKPNAVKVAVGGINVISGESDSHRLNDDPQDYIVCPDQPWLDGINTGQDSIRQFVAMPLGLGYTVEASLTGTEKFGGIQMTVFEPKPGKFPDEPPLEPEGVADGPTGHQPSAMAGTTMGLGAGGVMKQKIYPDPYGIDTWDHDNFGSAIIHIVNSAQFHELTGIESPPTPIDAKTYTEHGLPWFDLFDESKGDIGASGRLTAVETITERDAELSGSASDHGSVDVPETQIKKLGKKRSGRRTHPPTISKSSEHSSEGE